MELPLVDVNRDTVPQTWPLLLEAVKHAHFIALDLELSGLGNVLGPSRGPTPESRYSDLCETVNSRAILSVGIACFRWKDGCTSDHQSSLLSATNQSQSSNLCKESPELTRNGTDIHCTNAQRPCATDVETRVFNVWMMCQKAYTIDPVSARFLLQHGFDFNKQIAKGLPYSPGPLKVLESECGSVHTLLATVLATGKPVVLHNGWIDLLFLYGSFYAPLPPSLDTLMADLSEMFEGGVYDTKAIAQFEVAEDATFLEYLFRKCQRDNDALMTRGSPHLHLNVPSLPSFVPSEVVPLSPSHTPSLEEVVDTAICDTFSRYGFCHKADCQLSHDVLMVLLHQEHQLQIREMRRKRKLEQRKAKVAQLQSDDSPPPKHHCGNSVAGEEAAARVTQKSSTTTDLIEQFTAELEAARSRLATTAHHSTTSQHTTVSSNRSTPCTSQTNGNTLADENSITALKPSFGHRAGFDAFMTGYVFAYYAVTQNKHLPLPPGTTMTLDEAMIVGLSPMRNRLGNRKRTVPLILAKSQFTKTSAAHREKCTKIAQFKKSFYKN